MSNYHRISCACGESWGSGLNWAHKDLDSVISLAPEQLRCEDRFAARGIEAAFSTLRVPVVDTTWLRTHSGPGHALHVACEYADPCRCGDA